MTALSAIESSGSIDAEGRLLLNDRLPITGPRKVRVIILADEPDEMDEKLWLHAHTANPAFDDLLDPAEDVYTLDDGRPLSI